MKKIILFISLAILTFAGNAQSIKVQSAYSDFKNKRFDRAKTNIDEASEHESTKNDAKTWRYKAAIYYELALTDKEKYKNLSENPLKESYTAALKCMELDKEGEYARDVSNILKGLAIATFDKGSKFYEKEDYTNALTYFNDAIAIAGKAGDKSIMNSALYNASLAADILKDTAAILKNNQALVNARYTEGKRPYVVLYQIYKQQADTVKAMDVVAKLVRNMPNDPEAHILLATGYAWLGNTSKVQESIQKALTLRNDSEIIFKAGAVLEQAGDIEGARTKYEELLKLNPEQYDANYYLGVLHFNQGVDKVKASIDAKGKESEALVDESNKCFNTAIPYFEAAVKAKPTDINGLNALKQVYFRMNMYDKSNEIDQRINEINAQ